MQRRERSMRTMLAGTGAAALLLTAALPVAAWAPETAREIVTGFGPRAVALADLDGNGLVDLVTANAADRSVSLMVDPLGAGLAVSEPLAAVPLAIATGDVDGDGDADIVVGLAGPDGLLVLAGDGAGGIERRFELALPASPNAVSVTDLDHDGHAEIAVGTADGGVRLVRAVGGSLVAGPVAQVGGTPIRVLEIPARHSNWLAVVDGASGAVTVLRTDHNRLRSLGRTVLGTVARDAYAVRSGQDTLLVVTLPERSAVALVRLGTNGRPVEAQRLALASRPVSVTGADVDLDGTQEVVVTTRASEGVATLDVVAGHLALAGSVGLGICPSAIAAGRMDADALPDLAIAETCSNDVLVLAGD